jgi:hypothetical protein
MRLLAALTFGALVLSLQSSPPQRLAGEIDRVRAETTASVPDGQQSSSTSQLDRARAALDAGRPFLALYLMEAPWETANASTFVKASSAVITPDAFTKKWTEVGEPRPVTAPRAARIPAVVEALASAAEARGAITYHASKPYAEDAGLEAGLFYLGESHAVMLFAAMARGLDVPVAGTAPAVRSISAELTALDTEMTTAYETMDRSSHPTYIVASAALKQARTLNDRGQFAGALFEYLLSRYLFAGVRGPAAQEATAARIAEARQALPQGADHSIVELFLQLADEGVAGNVPAQRRGAAAALEDVLPAYRAAIAPASAMTTAAPAAQVTITLVRWPFT